MNQDTIKQISQAVVNASSHMSNEHLGRYEKAILDETSVHASWVLEQYVENAKIASLEQCALCDDTGVPHLILDIGRGCSITSDLLESIYCGVAHGLSQLPARPMAVLGDERQRLEQSIGLNPEASAVVPAPLLLRYTDENIIRLHVLMLGGGPEIRGIVKHVYHEHSLDHVTNEIVKWALQGITKLGCTPCTLAVGIGRSLYEASALMMEAQIEGRYHTQSLMEQTITDRINESNVGPLGLGGNTTVLATFIKVGHQRASGVRIVALRPCCCVEPRLASVILLDDSTKE